MDAFNEYIETLPIALSADEQNKLLEVFYATRNPVVREKLISHNLRLVANCVIKYRRSIEDSDDLMQIGTLELMNVLDNKFDVSRGVKFSTFVYDCVKYKILGEYSFDKKSMDQLRHSENKVSTIVYGDEEFDIFDVLSNDDDWVGEFEEKDKFDKFLETLSERDAYIIKNRIGVFGYNVETFEQIAEKFNCKVSTIRERFTILMVKLRKYYSRENGTITDEELLKAINYIAGVKDPKIKQILESYYGLNGRSQTRVVEIARSFKCSLSEVYEIIDCVKNWVRSPEDKVENIRMYIETSHNKAEVAVAEYFYGLHDRPKLSMIEIANALNIKYNTVVKILERLKTKVSHMQLMRSFDEDKVFVTTAEIREYCNNVADEKEKRFLEMKYGLNGVVKHTLKQMADVFGGSPTKMYNWGIAINQKIKDYYKSNYMSM